MEQEAFHGYQTKRGTTLLDIVPRKKIEYLLDDKVIESINGPLKFMHFTYIHL